MTDGVYATLGRQAGLMREMAGIAQNIANASTTGYRRGGVVFSEFIAARGSGQPSLSMSRAGAPLTRELQGALTGTGGTLDLAIEGEGYFQIDRAGAVRLTRAGAFSMDPQGGLVTADGHPVLDLGGAPIQLPTDAATLHVGLDGTISADGAPVAQLGIVAAPEPERMRRDDGTRFEAPDGTVPVEAPRVLQGFLENANVDPVIEIARMVAVQNAYQLGQGFLDAEDQRLRSVSRLLER